LSGLRLVSVARLLPPSRSFDPTGTRSEESATFLTLPNCEDILEDGNADHEGRDAARYENDDVKDAHRQIVIVLRRRARRTPKQSLEAGVPRVSRRAAAACV